MSTQANLYGAALGEDRCLVVDNVSSGTSYFAPDGTEYNYRVWFRDTEWPGYDKGIDVSWDGGVTFCPWRRLLATPARD